MHGKDLFYPDPADDLAYGDGGGETPLIAHLDDKAVKDLDALFVAFADLAVDPDGLPRAKFGSGLFLLLLAQVFDTYGHDVVKRLSVDELIGDLFKLVGEDQVLGISQQVEGKLVIALEAVDKILSRKHGIVDLLLELIREFPGKIVG